MYRPYSCMNRGAEKVTTAVTVPDCARSQCSAHAAAVSPPPGSPPRTPSSAALPALSKVTSTYTALPSYLSLDPGGSLTPLTSPQSLSPPCQSSCTDWGAVGSSHPLYCLSLVLSEECALCTHVTNMEITPLPAPPQGSLREGVRKPIRPRRVTSCPPISASN